MSMRTVTVIMTTTCSRSVDYQVEADSDEEACILALDDDTRFGEMPEICAQCSGWGRKWSQEVGDEPTHIAAVCGDTYQEVDL